MTRNEHHSLQLLLLSTPVGPLGSGIGGGVELTVQNLVRYLQEKGDHPEVAAPHGSDMDGVDLVQITGNYQPKAQTHERYESLETPENAVLTNMLDYARKNQHRFSLIVNFAYDWLPLYLTPSFDTPLLHFISMSSLNDTIDREIGRITSRYEHRVACYSRSQAATFPNSERFEPLGAGIELDRYEFCPKPDNYLVWVGRISREKGLEDAIEAAQKSGLPLKILGKLEDPGYWQSVKSSVHGSQVDYEGFLPTGAMQKVLGRASALLMTPKWTEAFGMVAVEALACGVPVISYARGGPTEIIKDGETGFLVEPGRIDQFAGAISRCRLIDRSACRKAAEQEYTLDAWGERVESWFRKALSESEKGR